MTTPELVTWIRQLYACGKIYLFYNSREFKELRDEVFAEYHYECQRCLERGKYTRATVAHHEKHVKDYPGLALSKTYIDERGKTHRQITPLCDACHNEVHPEKFGKHDTKERFTNSERW